MSSEWVCVVLDEKNDQEPIEIPTEPDGTLLLATIKAQYPNVTGLKFRNEVTNTFRAVRVNDDKLFAPHEDGKWGTTKYVCVRPSVTPSSSSLKRKANDLRCNEETQPEKMSKEGDTIDLICLGIPFRTSEKTIRDYFERNYGPVLFCQVKTKENGQSKGYAFIRFESVEVQGKVLMTRHMVDGRWCDVKIPESQEPGRKSKQSNKIFVARVSDNITKEDLKEHFENFGEVTDVFYPQPFRGFAFVTFVESRVAESLLNCNHMLKGVSIHIGNATPKSSSHHSNKSSQHQYQSDPWYNTHDDAQHYNKDKSYY